jgi:fatty acid desaturase
LHSLIGQGESMIDRAFFEPNPAIYSRDFLISMMVFIAAFIWGLSVDWPLSVLPWGLAAVFLARAGIFGHEISHRPNHKRMKTFYWLWHLTVGAIILVPTARFVEPHKAHHTTGIFRTKDDPQYLLVRSNRTLALFVLVALPFLTPLYTLFQVIIASIGGVQLEESLDRLTRRIFNFSVSTPLPASKKTEVTWLSRYYLLVVGTFAYTVPEGILLYYAVLVGAWLIIVLRIPLEHELETYAETSKRHDQMRDSFTVETPLALIIQPIGFRYHTAHHMYPGVPYHNLPAVHEHLKATVPGYTDSIVSYGAAIRGPKYSTPPAGR